MLTSLERIKAPPQVLTLLTHGLDLMDASTDVVMGYILSGVITLPHKTTLKQSQNFYVTKAKRI